MISDVEACCEVMHDAYEEAAVGAGWETQTASRKPWSDVPEANKKTMRVAVAALLAYVDPDGPHAHHEYDLLTREICRLNAMIADALELDPDGNPRAIHAPVCNTNYQGHCNCWQKKLGGGE